MGEDELVDQRSSSFISTEIRWFLPGKIPKALENLFCNSRLHQKEPTRTDRYVNLEKSDACGIKIREGALEVKTFVRAGDEIALDQKTLGKLEVWEKVRLSEDMPMLKLPSTSVEKSRYLRKFTSPEKNKLIEVEANRIDLTNGCNLEISQIKCLGKDSWSLNFEAYGNVNGGELIRKTIDYLYKQEFDLYSAIIRIVDAQLAMSYPAWLKEQRN